MSGPICGLELLRVAPRDLFGASESPVCQLARPGLELREERACKLLASCLHKPKRRPTGLRLCTAAIS